MKKLLSLVTLIICIIGTTNAQEATIQLTPPNGAASVSKLYANDYLYLPYANALKSPSTVKRPGALQYLNNTTSGDKELYIYDGAAWRQVILYGQSSEIDPIWTAAIPNYYTKTDLQNAGSAAVHWNNITNKPTLVSSESDPVWTAASTNYYTKTQSDTRYLQSFTETDPLWTASPSHGITSTNITNWTQAFNKYTSSGAYSSGTITFTRNDGTTFNVTGLPMGTESDPIFTLSPAGGIGSADITHWNQAYNKYLTSGSYSAGTLTFIARDGTTAFTVTGLATGGGSTTLAALTDVALATLSSNQLLRYNSSTTKWENWTPNFLTSYTETDPVYGASAASGITSTNITNWTQAYNKYTASGVYSGGTITFTRNDATTYTVTGIPTGSGGITTLNTLTGAVQTFATGTSGTDFSISSTGTTHTFNIPDASSSNRGLVTTGTQTLAGAKTFSGAVTANSGITIVDLNALKPITIKNNVSATMMTFERTGQIQFWGGAGSAKWDFGYAPSDQTAFYLAEAGVAYRMTIWPGGNFRIGSTDADPSIAFQVDGASRFQSTVRINPLAGSGAGVATLDNNGQFGWAANKMVSGIAFTGTTTKTLTLTYTDATTTTASFTDNTTSGGTGLTDAYNSFTDGTNTASASGATGFKFRSANNLLTVAVTDNDATHGDNLLLTVNQSNLAIAESQVTSLTTDLAAKQSTLSGTGYVKSTAGTISYDNSTFQPQISGTGFVKASGTTISFDNTTYLPASSVSGTSGYLPQFTGTSTIGNSGIFHYTTGGNDKYGIGTSTADPTAVLHIESVNGDLFLLTRSSIPFFQVKSDGSVLMPNLQSSTTDRIVGMTNSTGNAYPITIGTGLSLSGNTLTATTTGTLSGSGTTNNIPKYSGSTTFTSSVIWESSGKVGINQGTPLSSASITVKGQGHSTTTYSLYTTDDLTTATAAIRDDGTILAAGDIVAFNSFSDRRLKENIVYQDKTTLLNKTMALRPVKYNFINNPRTQYGFIAQDVKEILPELVDEQQRGPNGGNYFRVDYEKITAINTGAIQELKAQIDALREQVKDLIQLRVNTKTPFNDDKVSSDIPTSIILLHGAGTSN